jgi:tubulin--tyrosine ligase
LIRKHNLPTTVAQYTAKRSGSILKKALPLTFPFELAYLDDLDELLIDDLYELQQAFDGQSDKWWILKPGLADKGQGIRLFRTREQLEAISEEEEVSSTKVSLQTMRHWVVQVGGKNLPPDARLKREMQEYIADPLLIITDTSKGAQKFHLRVYVLAIGSLKLVSCERLLS